MKCKNPGRVSLIQNLAAVCLLALLCTSCSRHATVERHLTKADAYFQSGRFEEAEIEYKNVLQADGLNSEAIAKLGIIYYDQGSVLKSIPYLLKGHELEPDRLELRLKLGQISLGRGAAKEAHDAAIFILAKNPTDQDAPVLMAEAATKPAEIEEARQRLEQLPNAPENGDAVLVALGTLDFKQHKPAEAEASFRKAVTLYPKSTTANFALGSLLWQKKEIPAADQALGEATKLAPTRSPVRLKYAQFKVQTGDSNASRKILEETIQKAPDYIPALMMLAEIDVAQKNADEADSLIAKVLQRDSNNPEAILLSARIKLVQGDAAKAIAILDGMQGKYPKYAPVYYALGQAYLAGGDVNKAVSSLERAVVLNPNLTDAIQLLAQTNIRKGDFKAATVSLRQLVRSKPNLPQPRLMLAEAYRGQGDLDSALEVYRELEKSFPKNPETALLTGMMLLQQDKREAARLSFNRALELAPFYLPAEEQLINVDLMEGKYSDALERANGQLTKNPKSAAPHLFLAKIYLAQNDMVDAESALLKAIDLQPDAPAAYLLLARLYATTNHLDKAMSDLQSETKRNPKDVGALMMIGTVANEQKDYPSARDAYEKILVINPLFSSALNNLAYLYSEKFNQLDKGYDMAQKARELLPNEPHAADTLGWILYKKHQFTWALGLLQESASALPTEPDVQYHLGMAHYMMGDEEAARSALEHALQLGTPFAESDEAKKSLSTLAIDATNVGETGRPALEKSLADRTDDPVAHSRLASLYERDGALDKAVAEDQTILQGNPSNVEAMLNLVRLYGLQRDTKKAMDLAKELHKQKPNDQVVSLSLGRLAYQTGDYQWAFSLLQESARGQSENPEALYDYANSAYSVGKVPDAVDAMNQAVKAGLSGAHGTEANRFLEMTALLSDPTKAIAEASQVQQALQSTPGYVPALMAQGTIEEAKNNSQGSIQNYEKVLSEYPDFAPAKRNLALLYSQDPGKDLRTSELGLSAREAYPDDAAIARALGIVAYRRTDYSTAAGLLQESAQKKGDDAELNFYLGMTQYQLKNRSAARQALQHALDLGLGDPSAAKARQVLLEIK
jgi:tetratricopeptide (TPR) repeat protein